LDLWDVLKRVNLVAETSRPDESTRPATSALPSQTNPVAFDGSTASPARDEDEVRVAIRSLDQEVTECDLLRACALKLMSDRGGQNFSAGQRQLLALARGILKLKFSRVLILDEASAS
jgi:ABC-type glutathione transport system ATPase component